MTPKDRMDALARQMLRHSLRKLYDDYMDRYGLDSITGLYEALLAMPAEDRREAYEYYKERAHDKELIEELGFEVLSEITSIDLESLKQIDIHMETGL